MSELTLQAKCGRCNAVAEVRMGMGTIVSMALFSDGWVRWEPPVRDGIAIAGMTCLTLCPKCAEVAKRAHEIGAKAYTNAFLAKWEADPEGRLTHRRPPTPREVDDIGKMIQVLRMRLESVRDGMQSQNALGPALGWLDELEHMVKKMPMDSEEWRQRRNTLVLAASEGVYAALATTLSLGEAAESYNIEARTLAGDAFETAFEWAREREGADGDDDN